MFSIVRQWCIDWLERRGLQSIAAVLEMRAAQGGNVEAMHAAAKRALLQGQHGVALTIIAPALKKQPENASLWCTRGVAHRLALSYDLALADYEHAYQLDPTDGRTLGNLGEWHLARDRKSVV